MEEAGAPVIVVDTNVVANLVVSGRATSLAEQVRRHDPEWVAPSLVCSELRNVLSTSMRAQQVSLEEALDAASQAEQVLRGSLMPVSSITVLDLASRSGCTAYDREFVSVAMELGVPLVTSDRQVLAAFPEVAVSPEVFVAD